MNHRATSGSSAAECTTGHARDGAGPSTGACRSRAAALLLDLARLRRFSDSPFLVAIGRIADISSGRSKCRNRPQAVMGSAHSCYAAAPVADDYALPPYGRWKVGMGKYCSRGE